jgi:hypothetical protein
MFGALRNQFFGRNASTARLDRAGIFRANEALRRIILSA